MKNREIHLVRRPEGLPRLEDFELVETDIEKGVVLIDLERSQPTAFEVLSGGRSYLHVRFMAADVPPVGYKCFALRPGSQPEVLAPTIRLPQETIESRYYRVVLDANTAAVRSIFDKELGKEVVATEDALRFNLPCG